MSMTTPMLLTLSRTTMTMLVMMIMMTILTCVSNGDGEESREVGSVDGGDDEAEEPPGG